VAVALLSPAAAAAAPRPAATPTRHGASYERWVKAPEPWPLERRLLRTVKSWAEKTGLRLEDDARLALVARGALAGVPRVPGTRLDLELLRRRAHELGWTDGELAAVAVRLPAGADPDTALPAELQGRLGSLRPNRIGLAARLDGDADAVLVLFSRRLVRLWPLPAQVRRNDSLEVSGSVASGDAVLGLTLVVGLPGGQVLRRPVPAPGGAFDVAVPVGAAPGVLSLQLLLDRGRGPEIAAQLPIGVDHAPDEPAASAPSVDEPLADDGTADDLGRRLAALVLGARDAARVPLPAASAALDEVAAGHARDMHDHGFFAHVSPTSGDLTGRLAARGVTVRRALENLARGRTLDEVLRQWLVSPAHRQNLLDPEVDAFGVAAVPTDNGEIIAVLVLARRRG
jgi:uncharacterized protein YkwD